jgi:hypothetical protein
VVKVLGVPITRSRAITGSPDLLFWVLVQHQASISSRNFPDEAIANPFIALLPAA